MGKYNKSFFWYLLTWKQWKDVEFKGWKNNLYWDWDIHWKITFTCSRVCRFHFVLCKVPLYCRAGPGLLEVHSGTEASGCQQMLLPNLSVPLRVSGAFTDVQSQAQPAAHHFGWRVDSSDHGSPLRVEPGRSGRAWLGFCLFSASGCLLVWQSFNCIFKLHDELPEPVWEYPSQNDVGFNAMKPAGTTVIKCSILLVNTWEKGNE